jgi:hypothetical protein
LEDSDAQVEIKTVLETIRENIKIPAKERLKIIRPEETS